ncbi:MAG: MFS transporter [Blastomonas sp.]
MGGDAAYWSSARRGAFLALLCLIGLISFVDRQIITILVEPIKAEFGVSDTAMGALTGIIFSGFYAAAAIPLARLSDRTSRRNMIAACLAFWSVMTSIGGFAVNFVMLAMTRVGVAVAEAGANPASHSLVADLFPVGKRATALGALSASQAIGIGLGVYLGAVLVTAFDWRTGFLVVGVPGVLVAVLLLLSMKEPPRGLSDGGIAVVDQPPFLKTMAELLHIPTYRYLFLTVAFAGFCGYGMLAWGPTFLIRVHGMPVDQIGFWFGLAIASSLVIGNLGGGWLSDQLGRGDMRNYLWVGGAGPLLSVVPGLFFAFSGSWQTAIAALFAMQLVLTTHIPTCYSLAQTLVMPRMRAMASVVIGLGSGLIGAGLAPLAIGAVNDLLIPRFGSDANRYALLLSVLAALGAAISAFLGTRHVRADYAALPKAPEGRANADPDGD